MAPHLIKKQFTDQLFVYDINEESVTKIVKEGAIKCKTIEEVSKNSEIIITMLPASKHVRSVYETLLLNTKGNQFFIDASTIDPQTTQELSTLVKRKDSKFCDAPVSGGVGGAESGTLTFMVGGTNEEFEKSQKILINMGKNIFHCGSVGMGQVAKICNNLLLAISMTGVYMLKFNN